MPTPSKPVDTNVKVPAAVARAAAAAEAAQAAAYPAAAPAPDPAPVNDTITLVEPPAPQAPIDITDINQPPVAPSAPATVTPQGNPTDPNDETWQHKFNSVNGRYTRQTQVVDQMQQTISSLQDQINVQNEIIQGMAASAPAALPAPAAHQPLITDSDVQAYGADFIDIVKRAARDAVAGDIGGLQNLLAGMDQKVTTVDTRVRTETDAHRLAAMEQMLDRELPTWREVNVNDEFKSWLLLQNPYTGDIRNNELQAAWAARKAPQVLAFFRGFVSEQAATAPQSPNNPQPASQPASGVTLEDLAAPGRARAPAANEPPAEKPIITRQQITDFYTAVRQGKYRGRDEEKARHEAMIILATREGRVR
jgi:hypothetical protein